MRDIIIRAVSEEDAPRLLEIYAPYVRDTAITFELDVPSPGEFSSRVSRTLEKYPYLAAERGGRIIGYAYAGAFHPRAAYAWCAEVSIYVDVSERRTGAGRALYEALERCLAAMGIKNLYACIAYPESDDEHLDKNSVNFHSHFGYELCGRFHRCGFKFSRWYDMVWMEKMLSPHSMAEPVKTFGEIRKELSL